MSLMVSKQVVMLVLISDSEIRKNHKELGLGSRETSEVQQLIQDI